MQRDDTRVRVSAELVQIDGGLVRWAETYDRALQDVFALQSDIAEAVALSLVAQTVGESEARSSLKAQQAIGGTKDVAAFAAFLRGHALYDLSAGAETDRDALEQFDAAISQMQRALEINPSLASAQFVIANARLMQGDAAGAPTAAKAERVPQFALTMTAIAADRLGDTVEADVAYAKRDSGMLLAPNDPMLDPLRGEPKLGELLSRLAS